jgi:hypothetical protein
VDGQFVPMFGPGVAESRISENELNNVATSGTGFASDAFDIAPGNVTDPSPRPAQRSIGTRNDLPNTRFASEKSSGEGA